MTDYALDALLAEYVAPPVPQGLAARVAAAALALPQEPGMRATRRAAAPPRHDRRRAWLRRPLLVGGVALGLAVSGAVAATLAGVRIDWPAVEALLPPFLRGEAPRETVPARLAPPVQPPPPATPAPAAPPVPDVEAVADRVRVETVIPPVARGEAPPVAVPEPAPARSDLIEPRRIEARPAVQPRGPAIEATRSEAPAAAPERDAVTSTPAAEPRTAAADELRLQREQQERLERAERLRAARQAQIERLQRVQQRRERLRRLRRD